MSQNHESVEKFGGDSAISKEKRNTILRDAVSKRAAQSREPTRRD